MPRAGTTQVRGGKVHTIDQTAKHRKPGLWLGLLVLVGLTATLFAPKFVLWFGIILLVLCIGAFLKTGAGLVKLSERMSTMTTVGKMAAHVLAVLSIVGDFSRRVLRLNSSEKWRSGVRLAVYGLVGLVLIVAGWTGAGYKAERERIAANEAAANAKVVALLKEAETAWKSHNLGLAQEKLDAASKTPNATELAPIHQLRTRIANAKVEVLITEATKALNNGDIETGKEKVQHALAVLHADALTEARKLDQQISNTTDPTRIRIALMELSDEAFQQLKNSGTMPAQMLSGYQGLDRRTAELAMADLKQVAEVRENRRLAQLEAERKREEEARLATEAAARKAEAARQRNAEAQAEAAQG